MIRDCSYPEALWGPLILLRSFLLMIISTVTRRVQSTHQEASKYEETGSARERSVRWCRRRCVSPGYMLLSSSRGVRTMYPRVSARISSRFQKVQRLIAQDRIWGGGGTLKAPQTHFETVQILRLRSMKRPPLSHISLWPWLHRKAVGNTVAANSGNRGPSPHGDATAREPMRCRGGVAWQEGREWWCQTDINEQAVPAGPKLGTRDL